MAQGGGEVKIPEMSREEEVAIWGRIQRALGEVAAFEEAAEIALKCRTKHSRQSCDVAERIAELLRKRAAEVVANRHPVSGDRQIRKAAGRLTADERYCLEDCPKCKAAGK